MVNSLPLQAEIGKEGDKNKERTKEEREKSKSMRIGKGRKV
jgi:hypothetical protein